MSSADLLPYQIIRALQVTLAAPNHGDTRSTECRDMWNIARARAVQDCDHQDVQNGLTLWPVQQALLPIYPRIVS